MKEKAFASRLNEIKDRLNHLRLMRKIFEIDNLKQAINEKLKNEKLMLLCLAEPLQTR